MRRGSRYRVAGWACLAVLSACRHAYTVEDRETPVHVWIENPAAASRDVDLRARVLVGERSAVDGVVHFSAGRPRVFLPPVYVAAGERTVSVELDGGRRRARAPAAISGPTWILVRALPEGPEITVHAGEPGAPK